MTWRKISPRLLLPCHVYARNASERRSYLLSYSRVSRLLIYIQQKQGTERVLGGSMKAVEKSEERHRIFSVRCRRVVIQPCFPHRAPTDSLHDIFYLSSFLFHSWVNFISTLDEFYLKVGNYSIGGMYDMICEYIYIYIFFFFLVINER